MRYPWGTPLNVKSEQMLIPVWLDYMDIVEDEKLIQIFDRFEREIDHHNLFDIIKSNRLKSWSFKKSYSKSEFSECYAEWWELPYFENWRQKVLKSIKTDWVGYWLQIRVLIRI